MQKTLAIAISAALLASAADAQVARAARAVPPPIAVAQKAIRQSWFDYSTNDRIVSVTFTVCTDVGSRVACQDVLRQSLGTSKGHTVYGFAPGTDSVTWRGPAHRQVLVDRQLERKMVVS